MKARPVITYSLAVHNSAAFLEEHVGRLVERLREFPSAEIVLVENGSQDGSLALAWRLATRWSTDRLAIRVDTVARGLGNAHRRGIALSTGEVLVIIGVDLPFGFGDLDQWTHMPAPPALVLGSKSHPGSRLRVSRSRRILSAAFRRARTLILGIDVGDSQGSIIIDGNLARRVQPHLACTDYLVTTEIVAWAMRFGARPLEIPVDYPGGGHSTVSPVVDGIRMLMGMLALRGRLRASRAAIAATAPAAPRA